MHDGLFHSDTPLSSEPGAGTVILDVGLLHFEQRNRRADVCASGDISMKYPGLAQNLLCSSCTLSVMFLLQ